MITLDVGGGFQIKVDDLDKEAISRHKWFARSFRRNRTRYAVASGGILMHRLILGLTDRNMHVDHINHDGLDNRRCNLRISNSSQNCANRRPSLTGASKYLGVCPKRNKWRAQITFNRKTYYLGTFKTEIEAAIAYNEKAKLIHGAFANLNVV